MKRFSFVNNKHLLKTGIIIFPLIITLFPIYWILNTSLKPMSEVYSSPATFYPHGFTFDAYKSLFSGGAFLPAIGRSAIIAISVSFITILFSVPCSYAIARLKFRTKLFISRTILFSYLVPAAVLYIPLYNTIYRLGLINNILSLIIAYPTFTIPYATWILIPYFASIPYELEEAGLVDGCTKVKVMITLIIPLTTPGIVTTFIFSFTQCWGEYLYALVMVNKSNVRTVPLVISGLIWGDMFPWPEIMAGGAIMCIPILLIYMFASNLLVNGLTAGSIKQ